MAHWLASVMLLLLADPFIGVWKMRVDKAKPGRVAAQVITISATEGGHKWSYDVEVATGKHVKFSIVTNIKAGKATMYSEDGKMMGEGKVTKKGATEWEVETPNNKSHGSISADGKTMTVVQTAPTARTIVFDKQ